MTSIDLLENSDEEALRSAVRSLFEQKASHAEVVRAYDEPDEDFSSLTSSLMSDLGTAGILVPESAGGDEAGMSAAGVVAFEVGRAVAPVPFLTSGIIATVLAKAAGDEDLLSALADGSARAAVAVRADAHDWTVTDVQAVGDINPSAEGEKMVRITGRVAGVAAATGASVLLVPAAAGGELLLVSVDAAHADVSRFLSLDETRRLADVDFADAPATVLAVGDAAAAALARARWAGLAGLAAECAGIAEAVFDYGLEYIRERRQFGRTIGSFQAIKHRTADIWIEKTQLNAAAIAALRTLDSYVAGEVDASEARVSVLTAAAYAKSVTVHIAEEVLQFLGGNGMTWEYPVHLYLKRAKANEILLGSAEHLLSALGDSINIKE